MDTTGPSPAGARLRAWVRPLSAGSLVLLFLVGTGLAFLPVIGRVNRMQDFCAALPAGMTYGQALALAEQSGYETGPLAKGEASIEDPALGSRRACRVAFGPTGLRKAAFGSAD